MSLCKQEVQIDGNRLYKYYSDAHKKIQCEDDGNIYPNAFVSINSTYTFKETDIPLNEISASTIVEAADVIGLSDYIVETIDVIDGKSDDSVAIDLGGAQS
jgi:hypothetical protein